MGEPDALPPPPPREPAPPVEKPAAASGKTYGFLVILLSALCILLVVELRISHKGAGRVAAVPVPPARIAAPSGGAVPPEPVPVQGSASPAVPGEVVSAPAITPPVPPLEPNAAPIAVPREKNEAKRLPGPLPVLSGTFYSPKNPVAIVNGESVKVGETVGNYQVIEILAESVRLSCDGEEVVIKLK
jgi:hypothetical protein